MFYIPRNISNSNPLTNITKERKSKQSNVPLLERQLKYFCEKWFRMYIYVDAISNTFHNYKYNIK